jgi:Fic family protein
MQLSQKLKDIDTKKHNLDSIRPLSAEQLQNLKKLYDIELTYNSNTIEGSTLTYSESKLILNEGLTIGGKRVSEHLEVVNHKEALNFIEAICDSKSSEITLKDIRDIHFLILKGISTKDAGVYRTKSVGVRESNGEIFHFTHPPEVIRVEDRVAYIQEIEKAQNEDSSEEFYEVVINAVDKSLDRYLEILSSDITLI